MIQTPTALRPDPAWSAPALAPLDEVLRVTEDTFLAAGGHLEVAVDSLRTLQDHFARLEQSLGPDSRAALEELTAQVEGDIARLQRDFASFLDDSQGLRSAVHGIRVEVSELDRVVRTMSNVAINARIQGNVLTPRQPQVTAFIQRLAEMASEAEDVLRQVKDAMDGVTEDIETMGKVATQLRETVSMDVMPLIVRLARTGAGVLKDQDQTARASADLASRMGQVFSEVSRLIVAMQIGDSTRQRLERARAVVIEGKAERDVDVEHAALSLAEGLIDGAVADMVAEVSGSVDALRDVQSGATEAIGTAREFYLSGASQQRGVPPHERHSRLALSLGRMGDELAAMRRQATEVGNRLDTILAHERTLRQIAHHVRLSGLNAVLICAKLGNDGRPLRELASWLRALTDQSDHIVSRLQGSLDTMRTCTNRVGIASVDQLESQARSMGRTAEALAALVEQGEKAILDTAAGFDATGRVLPVRLGEGVRLLSGYLGVRDRLAGFALALSHRRATLPAVVLPLAPGTPAAEAMARMRMRYSMQQERVIHDAILTGSSEGAAQPEEGQAPHDAEDLDDILF
nr:hypothetical protein [Paracoccus saliphilus]